MTPFEELVSGKVGPATKKMLMTVGAQTVRSRNYPAPSGKDYWEEDEVAELVGDLVVSCSDGRSFIDEMLADSIDDESLASIVANRIGIAFAERSRDSNDGQLARRVSKLLNDNKTLFHRVGATKFWTRDPSTAGDETDVTHDDLLRAAHAVPGVRHTSYNVNAERRSRYASKDDLERIATSILGRAGAPLHERVIIKVFADYFGLRPTNISIDENDDFDVAARDTNPGDAAAATIQADSIWEQLDDEQRLVVPYLEDSLTEIANELGIKRHRADSLRTSTRTIIASALGMTKPADIPANAPRVWAELGRRAMRNATAEE